MVSKNNRIKRLEEVAGRQSHFGIRKLTVGTASVLLGITLLFGANAKVAKAAGTDGASAANSVNNEKRGSTDDPAEGRTPEQQDENPAAGPSKAMDEEAAYKYLTSEIEQARNKGLTVSGPYDSKSGDKAPIPDKLYKSKVGVIYDNENLSATDMQKQADHIRTTIQNYVENRNNFIQGLKEQGIYKDGDVDPTTLAQHLILQSEPQARSEYEIQDNNGKWTTADKNDVVTVTRDPNAPFVNDPNNPSVNPAYAVHLKNNNQVTVPIIQITYTNLKNSEYDGKPLGKIVETFSDVHATDINDSEAALYISTNPTNGWLYTHCDGVTVTIQLYDNQAKQIKIDSSAYVSVSSLNSNWLTATPNGETSDIKGRTEAAQLLSKGSAMSIPESSVQVFPYNTVFSPSDNEDLLYNKTHNKDQINYWGKFFAPREADWNKLSLDQQKDEIQKVGNYVINNYSGWDTTGSNKIFGSALYKVEVNPIVIRSYVIRNSSNTIPGFWFTYSTTVPQTSFDAINAISYHFATAHSVTNAPKTVYGSQTVEYIDGKTKQRISEKDYPDKIQKVTFKGANGTVTDKSGNKYNVKKDKVTGKIVKVNSQTGEITDLTDIDNVIYDWTWNTNDKRGNASQVTADNVDVPKIKGYIASTDTEIGSTEKNTTQPGKIVPIKDKNGKETGKYVVPGNSISVDNPTTVVKVIYNQLGHIIPVDTANEEIPGTTSEQYKNAAVDPTKFKDPIPQSSYKNKADPRDPYKKLDKQSDENIETIDQTGTITPKDPTKDIRIVYDAEQHAYLFIVDQDNNNQSIVGAKKDDKAIPTQFDSQGYANNPIKFNGKDASVKDLESIGYVYVKTDSTIGKFDKDMTKDQQFTIYMKHAHVRQTEVKPATQTIKYIYKDKDKNGKEVVVAAPANARTINVSSNKDTFKRTVIKDKVTGKTLSSTPWTGTHTFKKVDTPRVDGYHADKKQAGGKTATPDHPDVNDTVVYTPNGHIIPVYPDPTDPTKPGQTIPNVDHPQYPTDPTDPTKVKPDTPIPKITGWHIAKNPDPGKTPGTVTPKDPTKDTLVIFAKDQYAQIIYRDVNDPNHIITLDKSPKVTGTAGDPITFGDKDNPTNKIIGYEDKGYVLVNDKFDSGKPIFDSNNGIQIFYIDFKHGTTLVTPDKPQKPGDPINPNYPDGPKWPKGTTADDLTRKATQTITYKYSDGSKPDTTKVENQDKAFTKTVTVDNVTGEIIKQTDWTPAGYKFDSVDTPRVDGYHADKKQAGGKLATPDHPNVYDTVVYTPNGHIIPVDPDGNPIPGIPEEPYVTDPNDPTKVVPDENVPKDPNGKYTPDKDTVTPEDPSQDTPVVYNPIPNVPGPSVGPSDNTPTPVTPTPGKTTEEKKPEETKPDETKPDENKDDKDVDEPDDDEDVVPTPRHHKKHNGGESSTTRSRPTGYTPAPKGSGYLDANGKVHYKLPQTGESNSEEMVAFLGGVAAAIGLIGLAGAKKRRHE